MSRKSIAVVLTKAEVTRLKQWVRAGSTPQQVVLRARILLATTSAGQDREVAAQLRVHRRTVALWRGRAHQQGIGCVWEIAPGRGRKSPYAAGTVDRLVEATLQTKPAGSTHWSTRSLARAQGVSKNTIHRIWQEHQLKPHLTKSFKLSRDPKFPLCLDRQRRKDDGEDRPLSSPPRIHSSRLLPRQTQKISTVISGTLH